MESSSTKTLTPPKIFEALQAGFDQTARHLGLVFFPIALDMFLWLAPQLRVKSLFQPIFESWAASVNQVGSPELQTLLAQNQSGIQQLIDQYNLFTVLHTFPIGIPSLQSGRVHDLSPFGSATWFELPNFISLMAVVFGLILIGLALGAIFFSLIARDFQPKKPSAIKMIFKQIVGTYSLTLILFFILLAVLIPIMLILLVLGGISLAVAQFVAMVFVFISIWLLLPLVFSTHGMFYAGQSPVVSLISSVRLVRGYMPGTGFFLVASLVVNEGLNIIWNIPDSQSWMMLIGILGHGFVATSLISASFSYYRSSINFMNAVVARSMTSASNVI